MIGRGDGADLLPHPMHQLVAQSVFGFYSLIKCDIGINTLAFNSLLKNRSI